MPARRLRTPCSGALAEVLERNGDGTVRNLWPEDGSASRRSGHAVVARKDPGHTALDTGPGDGAAPGAPPRHPAAEKIGIPIRDDA